MLYFALNEDGRIYNLCDCGDIEAAEASAKDMDLVPIWIFDQYEAQALSDIIVHHIKTHV